MSIGHNFLMVFPVLQVKFHHMIVFANDDVHELAWINIPDIVGQQVFQRGQFLLNQCASHDQRQGHSNHDHGGQHGRDVKHKFETWQTTTVDCLYIKVEKPAKPSNSEKRSIIKLAPYSNILKLLKPRLNCAFQICPVVAAATNIRNFGTNMFPKHVKIDATLPLFRRCHAMIHKVTKRGCSSHRLIVF